MDYKKETAAAEDVNFTINYGTIEVSMRKRVLRLSQGLKGSLTIFEI